MSIVKKNLSLGFVTSQKSNQSAELQRLAVDYTSINIDFVDNKQHCKFDKNVQITGFPQTLEYHQK